MTVNCWAEGKTQTAPLVLIGTLIDGTGADPLPDAVVVIEGKRITAVGPRAKIKIPRNAVVMKPADAVILPGFINTHVHGRFVQKLLETWAYEGVTTVRDLGVPSDIPYLSLRAKFRTDPKCTRVLMSGPILAVRGAEFGKYSVSVTSPSDARQRVNKLIDDGADVIKMGISAPFRPAFSPGEAAAIVETAHKRGKPVAAHLISTAGLRLALGAGVDDIHHLMSTGKKSDRLLKKIIDAGIYWVPTLEAVPPKYREKGIGAFKRYVKMGGKVAMGNDSGSLPKVEVGMPIKELLLMQECGMTAMEVIVASTRSAARVCRLEKELGTLEKGKTADILVVKGNPLDDLKALKNAQIVIHEGTIIRKPSK
ncbi:MAG: amidohydrolase family protein [bacterium]|nr:amidohydrolase family protein [bacterium]